MRGPNWEALRVPPARVDIMGACGDNLTLRFLELEKRHTVDMNAKAIVRYDGRGFAGWQVQPDERTVQGELERVLSQIASKPVRIRGASRTDAGVHAFGQVFSFLWPSDGDLNRLRRSMCKMLSPEIRVDLLEEAPLDFHPRKHALSKRYSYAFSCEKHPDPFSARYAWCVPRISDPEQVEEWAQRFVGKHDFAGFQGGGSDMVDTVRTIDSIQLRRGGFITPWNADHLWSLEFHGTGFLYKMVRNLTGALADAALGKTEVSRLDELLAAPAPFHGHTAPAHGLALLEVIY
jgi:tRNA pseudouridine38-40 synthase